MWIVRIKGMLNAGECLDFIQEMKYRFISARNNPATSIWTIKFQTHADSWEPHGGCRL